MKIRISSEKKRILEIKRMSEKNLDAALDLKLKVIKDIFEFCIVYIV